MTRLAASLALLAVVACAPAEPEGPVRTAVPFDASAVRAVLRHSPMPELPSTKYR